MYKCLVTGGAGFIGSNLVNYLLDMGMSVVVIDDESSKKTTQPVWNKNAKNFKLDVSNYSKTNKIYKDIDYVFHLAARSRIQPSIKNPTDYVQNNVNSISTVLRCSYENNVKRLVYSSSSSIYGNNSIPFNEDMKDDCLNIYSISKLFGEKICKIYNNLYNLDTISLRYFNVYGNNQPIIGEYATVIGKFLKQKENNEPLTVVGDGSQKRDFTNVSDIVEATSLAAFKNVNKDYLGKTYNVGTGKNYSINEIAEKISKNIKYIEKRPAEAKETLADISKFKKVFQWDPKIDLLGYLS
jgi:UDP-glucose 4-epimerase